MPRQKPKFTLLHWGSIVILASLLAGMVQPLVMPSQRPNSAQARGEALGRGIAMGLGVVVGIGLIVTHFARGSKSAPAPAPAKSKGSKKKRPRPD